MRAKSLIIVLLAGLSLLAAAPAVAASADLSLALNPAKVQINAFFNGTQVKVEGRAPAGAQVGVLLANLPHKASFRIKKPLFGFLWMNQEEVTFDGVPTVYIFQSSGAAPAEFQMDLAHMRSKVGIHDGTSNPQQLFAEFVKIKKGEGLYSLAAQGVGLSPARDGAQTFACTFEVPARMPLGTYRIQAFARDPQGRMIAGPVAKLEVVEVGFPAMLSSMAFNYSLLYGILAALLALLAGLVTSMLFKGGGGSH